MRSPSAMPSSAIHSWSDFPWDTREHAAPPTDRMTVPNRTTTARPRRQIIMRQRGSFQNVPSPVGRTKNADGLSSWQVLVGPGPELSPQEAQSNRVDNLHGVQCVIKQKQTQALQELVFQSTPPLGERHSSNDSEPWRYRVGISAPSRSSCQKMVTIHHRSPSFQS